MELKAHHQSSAKDKAGNELDGKSSTQITQSMGYGSDKGSDSSTTHSGINTSNITITDAAGQQAKTGQSVQEVIDQIKTDVTTDTAVANSGHIGNNFDKDRVQKELDLQREVTEQFSKNAQTAKNMINTKQQELLGEVEKLKAKDKNDPRIPELLNEAQNWQTGGLLLDSVVGILSGPNTNGAIGTIANAGKPWIAAEIGNYFKQDENKDKEAAHIMAHTILGGAIAAATGNNALGGALSAGGGEALAPMVKDFLYGKETKVEDLTADQKQTISSIISLGGAGVGGIVGGSGSDAVSGGQLAGNAVDNNTLFGDLVRKQVNDVKEFLKEKIPLKNNKDLVGRVALEVVAGTIDGALSTADFTVDTFNAGFGCLVAPSSFVCSSGQKDFLKSYESAAITVKNLVDAETYSNLLSLAEKALDGDLLAREAMGTVLASVVKKKPKIGGSAIPVPNKVTAQNGLAYQSNPKHTAGAIGNRPNAGIELGNSLSLFNSSIIGPNGIRYAKDKDGNLHRFEAPSPGSDAWHWNGATGQGANSLTSQQVPIEIRRALNMPSKGW